MLIMGILTARDMYIAIENALILSEGEITEEIQQLMLGVDDDVKNTIKFYCKKRREHVLLDKALEERIVKLKKKRDSLEKSIVFWEGNVDKMMKVGKYDSLELDEYSISYRPTSKVEIVDESLIPNEYMRTPTPKPPVPAPDKVEIMKALKNGHIITGAKLDNTPILKIE